LKNAEKINVAQDGGMGGVGEVGSVHVAAGGAIQAFNGTLNVNGDLTFDSGGKMYVIANPTNGVNEDIINIAGNANLTGAQIEVVGIGSGYVPGTEFVFMTGENLNGDLAETTYTDSSGQSWKFTFRKVGDSYLATGIHSDTPPVPPAPPSGLGWNRAQVAASLGAAKVNPNVSQPFKDVITKLDGQVTGTPDNPVYSAAYLDATRQLAGTLRVNGLQLGLYSPYRTVFNRLTLGSELFSGGAPIIYNNGYGPISGLQYRGAGVGEAYRGQSDQINPHYMNGEMSNCDIPYSMGENNFWADVVHVQTKTSGDYESPGYGISRTGILIGMDVQRRTNSRIGFLFGYFAPYLWQDSDRVEADDYHGALYFQKNYFGTDLYGYFGYAHQEYESRRIVNNSLLTDTPLQYNGKTSGDSFSMSLEVSKPRYYGNNFILRPLVGFDYLLTSQKGYTESGSGESNDLFGLRYDKAEYDQLFVRLGFNLKKEGFYSTANFRIQYINQFASRPYPNGVAHLVAAPDAGMNIHGVGLGRDYLNLGFGMNVFANEARSRFMSFDYDFNASRQTTAHALSLILVERY
jgi:uncharacterized protein YhjY with autotransporter beta-barrel domain